jgi:predicted transcriptional regulator
MAAAPCFAYFGGMADRMNDTVDAEASAVPETDDAKRTRLAWEADRIEEALTSARAGHVVSHGAVKAWVESWDTPDELPSPVAGA